jgi:hypothetical protein
MVPKCSTDSAGHLRQQKCVNYGDIVTVDDEGGICYAEFPAVLDDCENAATDLHLILSW